MMLSTLCAVAQTTVTSIESKYFSVDIDADSVTNAVGAVGTEDYNNFIASFEEVLGYWETILVTPELTNKVTIQFSFADDLGKNQLGGATSSIVNSNQYAGGLNKDGKLILTAAPTYTTRGGLEYNFLKPAQAKFLGHNSLGTGGLSHDIVIEFNSTFSYSYTDSFTITDSVLPYHFSTILLHEISHGMGVSSHMLSNAGMVVDPDDPDKLIPSPTTLNPLNLVLTTAEGVTSVHQGHDIDGNPYYAMSAWDAMLNIDLNGVASYQPGAEITLSALGEEYEIYNPAEWRQGSSISHLDDPSALTYYATSPLRINDHFNAAELAILYEMGYEVADYIPEPSTVMLTLVLLPAALYRRRRQNVA